MHLSTCALQFLPCFLQNGKWKLEVENGKWNVRSGLPYTEANIRFEYEANTRLGYEANSMRLMLGLSMKLIV